MAMNMWARPGTKVQCVTRRAGREADTERAKLYLMEGRFYTVAKTSVGSSGAYVALEEFPGIEFPTSLFEDYAA